METRPGLVSRLSSGPVLNEGLLSTSLQVLDLAGTFALSGAAAAVRRRLDLFGVLVLSFAAANSGGIARDVLIGAVPPAALRDPRYVAVSLLAGLHPPNWFPATTRLRGAVDRVRCGGTRPLRGGRHAEGAGLPPGRGVGRALGHAHRHRRRGRARRAGSPTRRQCCGARSMRWPPWPARRWWWPAISCAGRRPWPRFSAPSSVPAHGRHPPRLAAPGGRARRRLGLLSRGAGYPVRMMHWTEEQLRQIARRAMVEAGFEPDFPPAVVAETAAMKGPPADPDPTVKDLRGLLWCSIDNDDSRDLDQLTVAERPGRRGRPDPGGGGRRGRGGGEGLGHRRARGPEHHLRLHAGGDLSDAAGEALHRPHVAQRGAGSAWPSSST